MQKGAVVKRQPIVRLLFQNEVKVFDSQIVFANLHAQQSSVVMAGIIVGVQVESNVIVVHSSSQLVLLITCQRPSEEKTGSAWRLNDGLVVK